LFETEQNLFFIQDFKEALCRPIRSISTLDKSQVWTDWY